jgi:hypothetical protein
MSNTAGDPLEEIGQHIGQALRTASSAGLQAASIRAMNVERRARADTRRHRQHRVELVQNRRALDQAAVARRKVVNQASGAQRSDRAPNAEAARWIAMIAKVGGAELADEAWQSPAWDALANVLRAGEAEGRDLPATLAKVIPERDFQDGRDVAAILEWRVTNEFEESPAPATSAESSTLEVDQDLAQETTEFDSLLAEAELEVAAISTLRLGEHPDLDPAAPSALLWDQALAEAHIDVADAATRLEATMAEVERETERLATGPDQASARWLTTIAEIAGDDVAQGAWQSMNWPALAADLDRHHTAGFDVNTLLREAFTQDPIDRGADISGTLQWRVTELVGDDRLGQQAVETAAAASLGDTWQWTADDMLVQRRHHPTRGASEPSLEQAARLRDQEHDADRGR